MPEFIPQHVSTSIEDDFMAGYLAAFEWCWPEDGEDAIDRDKVRGWSRDAMKRIKADCKAFCQANRADLALYCQLRESAGIRGDYTAEECAGHDFYLSREGHGAGFFDRGDDPVFRRLQDAARRYGEAGYPYLSRGWVRI